jgi:beta-N-acetylhexosaminidase
MAIFKAQIASGCLDAMMPAHVVYPHYDSQPASGSSYWLKRILREQLNFAGIIFSDDLNMEGASVMGTAAERAKQSLAAGCDMLLLCNNRLGSINVLDNLPISQTPQAKVLLKQQSFTLSDLKRSQEWRQASEAMKRLVE